MNKLSDSLHLQWGATEEGLREFTQVSSQRAVGANAAVDFRKRITHANETATACWIRAKYL